MSKYLYVPSVPSKKLKEGNCFLAYPKNSYQYLKLINYLESRNYKFYVLDNMILIKKRLKKLDNLKIKSFLDYYSIEWEMGYISSTLLKIDNNFKVYEIKDNS